MIEIRIHFRSQGMRWPIHPNDLAEFWWVEGTHGEPLFTISGARLSELSAILAYWAKPDLLLTVDRPPSCTGSRVVPEGEIGVAPKRLLGVNGRRLRTPGGSPA